MKPNTKKKGRPKTGKTTVSVRLTKHEAFAIRSAGFTPTQALLYGVANIEEARLGGSKLRADAMKVCLAYVECLVAMRDGETRNPSAIASCRIAYFGGKFYIQATISDDEVPCLRVSHGYGNDEPITLANARDIMTRIWAEHAEKKSQAEGER